MISAVSNVSFRGDVSNSDWQKLIESEGQYTQKPAGNQKPDTVEISSKPEEAAKEKKGGKAGKIIGGTIAGVIVAGLALFGLYKGNILKINKEAKGMAKIGSKLAEAGDWVGTKIIDPILGLFKGKGAKAAANAANNAADTTAQAASLFIISKTHHNTYTYTYIKKLSK